jgi:hypothetical protein
MPSTQFPPDFASLKAIQHRDFLVVCDAEGLDDVRGIHDVVIVISEFAATWKRTAIWSWESHVTPPS